MREFSLPAVVRERASLQPNHIAFTFIDYDHDWDGIAESLTWSQLYRRMLNVAHQLRFCGSTGDRAVILAPQGLDYIVAFLGAMEAGRIAVPLSLPLGGATDLRVTSVLQDAEPTVILTTSSAVHLFADHVGPQPGAPEPTIIEVDRLDTERGHGRRVNGNGYPNVAYLQYTSGSTRMPAGVMVSNENIRSNFEQIASAYFEEYGGVTPPDTTFVS